MKSILFSQNTSRRLKDQRVAIPAKAVRKSKENFQKALISSIKKKKHLIRVKDKILTLPLKDLKNHWLHFFCFQNSTDKLLNKKFLENPHLNLVKCLVNYGIHWQKMKRSLTSHNINMKKMCIIRNLRNTFYCIHSKSQSQGNRKKNRSWEKKKWTDIQIWTTSIWYYPST